MPSAPRVPRRLSFLPSRGSRAVADGLLTWAMAWWSAARNARPPTVGRPGTARGGGVRAGQRMA
ncbi:hypothetical protein, partial [Micromonospora sicca]|uniref:hypothetical protein n=1 Tax=Micromonospora sicca TaxID=2202420 RepID=UPI001F18692F